MDVNISKGANVKHKFNIFFNEDVEDNSDIESFISKGEYFRTTLTFRVPDAYLWKTTKLKRVTISSVEFDATTDINDDNKIYEVEEIKVDNKE